MRQINSEDKDLLKSLYVDDTETFEQYVLMALYYDSEFRELCIQEMVYRLPNGREISMFSYPAHAALYKVIKGWRSKYPSTHISQAILTTYLAAIANLPRAPIFADDIPNIVDTFNTLLEVTDKESSVEVVRDTWRDWAMQRSWEAGLKEITRDPAQAVDIARSLNEKQASINNSSGQKTEVSVEEALMKADNIVERIPLSNRLAAINKCLNGGVGKGEHILFVAPSGGGKTVMACQLAAELASIGKHVLLFTTEQRPADLMPRIISCLSRNTRTPILASVLIDGIDKDKLTPAQWDTVIQITGHIKDTLHFEDWTATPKNVASDLRATVDKYQKKLAAKGETLDVVILDWIGGKLGEAASDSNQRRIIFENAATTMRDVALEFDVATISFAQATAAAAKKKTIGPEDIAECKSLHHLATAAFGISACLQGGEGSEVYSDIQTLNNFKSRKSGARVCILQRDFKYQSFICTRFRSQD